MRGFISFEATRVKGRRYKWGRKIRWQLRRGVRHCLRFLLLRHGLRRPKKCCTSVGERGDFVHGFVNKYWSTQQGADATDRMVGGGGGGDNFLDGLQAFCANFRNKNQDDLGGVEHQIAAVENLISRAKRQPGFDILEGLQDFINKERRNRGFVSDPSNQPEEVATWQTWNKGGSQQCWDSWKDGGDSGQSWTSWDAGGDAWQRSRWHSWTPQGQDSSRWTRTSRKKPKEANNEKSDSWDAVAWRPRLSDWESKQTTEIHFVHGAISFAAALDDHKDEAFLVMVDTVEEFLQCAGMAEGERNAMVTIVLSAVVTWPEDVEKPGTLRAPGQLRRGLQVRSCYYRAFSEGSPTLATKKTITPASVAAFKPSSQGTSASKPGWIVRFLLPWSYHSSGAGSAYSTIQELPLEPGHAAL